MLKSEKAGAERLAPSVEGVGELVNPLWRDMHSAALNRRDYLFNQSDAQPKLALREATIQTQPAHVVALRLLSDEATWPGGSGWVRFGGHVHPVARWGSMVPMGA